MKRFIQRDLKERGKVKNQAKSDFLKSWNIYYKKYKNKLIENNNQFIITKKTDIDHILKKLFN